jgi:hypothetical protein
VGYLNRRLAIRVVQINSIFLDSAGYLTVYQVFHAESKYRRKKNVRSAVLVRRRYLDWGGLERQTQTNT